MLGAFWENMDHVHCQDCGAHFTNRAEQHEHRCQPGHPCDSPSGQRSELAADAAGGIQERPAGSESVDTTIGTPNRIGRVFTRSHRDN
jgi:hypothetical protein